MGEVRYMISEAAKKLQVESHVLRYWEEELGLEIGRTDMGHRYYTEEDIQLFLCIQKLKNEGMLLRDLKLMIPELTATRKRLNATKSEKGVDSDGQAGNDKADAPGRHAGMDETGASDRHAGMDETGASDDITAEKHLSANIPADNVNPADVPADSANPANIPAESAEFANVPCKNPLSNVSTEAPPAALAPGQPSAPEADVIQVTQLEQVRSLIGDVLTDVVSANNETLKKDISRKVTADVIREMDFLFQANERREEEHYRKLDTLIRQQQASRREAARDTPIGRLKKLLT